MNRKSLSMGLILTAAYLGQTVASWLLYDPQANALIINLGRRIMTLSAIFGWLPIFTFRSRDGVKGCSYIHANVLVDTGVYRVVRHPIPGRCTDQYRTALDDHPSLAGGHPGDYWSGSNLPEYP